MTETTSSPGHFVRHDFKFRSIEVQRIAKLTDRYVRITFTGDDLADFATADADDHFKLVFRPDPDSEMVVPGRDENGWTYPEGLPRPDLRDYTPRRFDPVTRELDIDFVIHGDGPASNWAAQAKIGQQIGVVGPRGSWILDEAFDWYLLIGDETTWPSISRRLEEFPASAWVQVFVEVDIASDELPYETHANATITWVHRAPAAAGTSDVLEQTIRAAEFPSGSVYVWAGGEATTLRGIRRYLKNEIGIPVSHLSFSGHWKYGVADHDHHEAIED